MRPRTVPAQHVRVLERLGATSDDDEMEELLHDVVCLPGAVGWSSMHSWSGRGFIMVMRQRVGQHDTPFCIRFSKLWIRRAYEIADCVHIDDNLCFAHARFGIAYLDAITEYGLGFSIETCGKKVLDLLPQMLEKLMNAPKTTRSSVDKALFRLFQRSEPIFLQALDLVRDHLDHSYVMLHAVLRYICAHPLKEPMASARTFFLGKFTDLCCSAPKKGTSAKLPRSYLIRTFCPLTRSLGANEIRDLILPKLNRMLLRSTDDALRLLSDTYFIPYIQVDCSLLVDPLFHPMAKELANKDPVLQQSAITACRLFTARVSNSEALLAMVQYLVELAQSPAGKAKRDAVYSVLADIATVHGADAKQCHALGLRVSTQLAKQLETESKPPQRVGAALVSALIAWTRVSKQLSAELLETAVAMLEPIPSVPSLASSFHIGLLSFILDAARDPAVSFPTFNMSALMQDYIAKAMQSPMADHIRCAGVVACAIQMSIDEPSLDLWLTLWETPQLLPTLCQPEKVSPEEGNALCAMIALQMTRCLNLAEHHFHQSCSAMASLCLSPSPEVRQRAKQTLLQTLQTHRIQLSDVVSELRKCVDKRLSIVPGLCETILSFASCTSLQAAPAYVDIVWLLHHPAVSSKPNHAMRALLRRSRDAAALLELFAHNPEVMASLLAAPYFDASLEPQSAQIQTSVDAFCSIARRVPSLLLSAHVKNRVSTMLDATALASCSAFELRVYKADPSTVVAEVASHEPQQRKKASRQETDREWEERLKQELEEKKRQERIATGQDKETITKLKEQTALRQKMTSAVSRIEQAVLLIQALGTLQTPHLPALLLSSLRPSIKALTNVELLRPQMHTLFRALVSTLDRRVQHCKGLPTALLLAYRYDDTVTADEWRYKTVLSMLEQIHHCTETHQLDCGTVGILLPLLQHTVVSKRAKGNLRSLALDVLERQCCLEVYPRPHLTWFPLSEVVQLLLQVTGLQTMQVGRMLAMAKHLVPILTTDQAGLALSREGATHSSPERRHVALTLLSQCPITDESSARFCALIWLLCSDNTVIQANDVRISDEALQVWEKRRLQFKDEALPVLFSFLVEQPGEELDATVQKRACFSIAAAFAQHPRVVKPSIATLLDLFRDHQNDIIPGEFGRESRTIDKSHSRLGPILALRLSATSFVADTAEQVFAFLVSQGLRDPSMTIWENALEASLAIVKSNTQIATTRYLSLLESQLETIEASDESQEVLDQVREGISVLMGNIATFMEKEDPRIVSVMRSLFKVLGTPSYTVQKCTADCIALLIPKISNDTFRADVIALMMDRLEEGDLYADRKGAALGLAGLIKGLRISYLKKLGVMDRLLEAVQKKKDAKAREGALMAFDALFDFLGPKFEPYIVRILPHLLKSFGDHNGNVRKATQDASRTIMSHLTAHGVRMVLPLILQTLDDTKWQTKYESISMLGSMAFCAPQQLSSSLPVIVPKLLTILKDPHPKVHEATQHALRDIGSVVHNPEIQLLVPEILQALYDPSEQTKTVLQSLIETEFVNAVDTPALALLIPILNRGLRDRTGSTKRMAAQIIGSMCSFIRDLKDLAPYMDTMLDELQASLTDPNPDVRTASSRAIGQLFRGVGGDAVFDLIARLQTTLQDATNSNVERSGSAQGLSELFAALGVEGLEQFLPELVEQTQDSNPVVREGYLTVLRFLPRAFGPAAIPFLPHMMPSMLSAFADGQETVRSAAMQAGKAVVQHLAPLNALAVLDQLEPCLMHNKWRVREHTSVLVGDLLHRVCGSTISVISGGEIEFEDDDTVKMTIEEESIAVLGEARRNALFSRLYILQSDAVPSVRQTAWIVWKSTIHNTTRVLSAMIDTFVSIVIEALAADNPEEQEAASASLGELVRRTGDMVIPILLPMFLRGFQSPNVIVRKGVYMALCDVIGAAGSRLNQTKTLQFAPGIVSGLSSTESDEQTAAAAAFAAMHEHIGDAAITHIVLPLLDRLAQPGAEADAALLGLRAILRLCSGPILRHVIPALTTTAMTPFNAASLALLADVAGSVIAPHLDTILSSFVATFDAMEASTATTDPIVRELGTLFTRLEHDTFVRFLPRLLALLSEPAAGTQTALLTALGAVLGSEVDHLQPHLPALLEASLRLYAAQDAALQTAVAATVALLCTSFPVDTVAKHTGLIRTTLRSLTTDSFGRTLQRPIAVLEARQGIQPLLPVYQQALLYGTGEEKEHAVRGMGDLVRFAAPAALKPFVIKMTGPLIRVVGDRFNATIKASILETLTLLLDTAGAAMKAFVPQLQSTFVKALHDPDHAVSDHAATGLASLAPLNKRKLDSLARELVANAALSDDPSPTFYALFGMTKACGDALQKETTAQLTDAAFDALMTNRAVIAAADLFGVALRCSPPAAVQTRVEKLLAALDDAVTVSGAIAGLQGALHFAFELIAEPLIQRADNAIRVLLAATEAECRASAVLAAFHSLHGHLLLGQSVAAEALLLETCSMTDDEAMTVRQHIAHRMRRLAKLNPEFTDTHLLAVVGALLPRLRDSPSVRIEAEKALHVVLRVPNGRSAVQEVVSRLGGSIGIEALQFATKYL